GMRDARTAFRASLSVAEPNPQEITAALNRSQAAAQKLNENLHGALRDMASGLSPEARAKIAAHMQRRHHSD
ncbi:MAG: periplasmic heavy metal sensor, partial [Alphaproteobacteria bacterium]|nr:periplasmic heavy metal sensor [Alphaproteobacteria bacterium]